MIRREVALMFGPSTPRDNCVAARMEPTTPSTKKVCPAITSCSPVDDQGGGSMTAAGEHEVIEFLSRTIIVLGGFP
jgi:hypothetical protein